MMREKKKIREDFFLRCRVDGSFNESMKVQLSRLKIHMEDLVVNKESFGDKN